jgi:hypothetical protein
MVTQQQQQVQSSVTVIANKRPLPAERGQRSFRALKQQQANQQLQETIDAILPAWEKKMQRSITRSPLLPAVSNNSQQVALPAFLETEDQFSEMPTERLDTFTCLDDEDVAEVDTVQQTKVGPYRQWSPSAVACFVRKGDCNGCFYKNFFSESPQGCQMAEAVKHLIVKLGVPSKRHLSKVH